MAWRATQKWTAVKPQSEPRRGALWAGARMPATESANAPSRSRLCLAVWCTPGLLRLAGFWANHLTFRSRTRACLACATREWIGGDPMAVPRGARGAARDPGQNLAWWSGKRLVN